MEQQWYGAVGQTHMGHLDPGGVVSELSFDRPVGLVLCNPTGQMLQVNRVFCHILGRSDTALVGRWYTDVLHPKDRTTEEAALARLLTGQEARYRVEERYLRPDGSVRWVIVTTSLRREGDQRSSPLVVRRVVDTTERRTTEAERDLFFDFSPAGIAVFGFDGRFKRVNRSMMDILGWTEEELVGRLFTDFVHPDDLHSALQMAASLIAGRSAVEYEARVRTRTGEYRWLRSITAAARDVESVYSWTIDIHERKQSEALLMRRDAQLAEAQALARLGSWEWDGDNYDMEWSVELYRLLGLDPTRSPATREMFLSRVHRDDREGLRLVTESARVEGHPFSLDVRFTREDGAEGILLVRGRTVPGPSRRVARISGTAQDVTETRLVEATLRQSEERFRRMFEESPAGVALVDGLLRIQKANGALSRMLGRPTWTLEGASLAEVIHPDDVGVVTRLTRRALTGVIPGYETETRLRYDDGSELWSRLRASVVPGDGGQPGYVLQIIEDISEARDAETASRELDRLKDGFLRVVCHDLQNPLLTISQLADLALAETCLVGVHHEVLGRIAGQAARLRQMVTGFLSLDRLYRGDVVVNRRPTDVAALMSRVVERGDDRRQPLSVELGSIVVAVDAEQVEQIIENLLENALCHTPPGTPVWLQVEGASGALSITVEDAGPGVPDDLKAKIFELFWTGSATSPHTGVGLWVVARLAELHGGRAWVEDRPGGGARFCAVLHVPGDAAPEPAPADAEAADNEGAARGSTHLILLE